MSVILVVEQDAQVAESIREALRSGDLSVEIAGSRAEAINRARARAPRLLMVDTSLPQAEELLAAFCRARGGPGAVALVPAQQAALLSAADFQADELLAKPFSDDDLWRLIQRCLDLDTERSSAAADAEGEEQLTSDDIFGDVLAEVEAETHAAKSTTKHEPVIPLGDIERKLEETLSGVIPLAGKGRAARKSGPRKPRRPEPPTESEIDDLLDQTLSSLDIPTRARKPPTAKVPVREKKPVHEAPVAARQEPASPEIETAPAPPAEAPPARTPAPESIAPPLPAAPSRKPEAPPPPATSEARAAGPAPGLDDLLSSGDQFATQALPALDLSKELAKREQELARGEQELAEGEPFGDYTLLDRIAIGGMAEVWRARRRGVEGFQKTVAIKKILSHLTGSQDFVTMFIDEAKLAAQLTHNNIIQIYDLGKVGNDFFIAMEHVDGKDLRSILTGAADSRRPIPVGLGLFVARAVARALDYAHRKRDFDNRALGLVHRDVSPQNVLISWEGEIKLCDFGIVKAVAKASTTQMGALKGKLQYMSPEQAWGKNVDARSDIFSLGAVLYELLTGIQLFAGDSEIGVLDAVRECRIRSPREHLPEIPEDVDGILRKALAKTPEERYQTAGELEHDLGSALEGLRPAPSQKDLAAYLRALFAPEQAVDAGPAAEVAPVEVAPPADTPPPPLAEAIPAETIPAETAPAGAILAAAPAEAAPVEASSVEPPAASTPPPAAIADDEAIVAGEARGRGLKWVIAAVLVTVLIGAGVVFLRSQKDDAVETPAEPPEATLPAPAEVAPATVPASSAPADGADATEAPRTADAADEGAAGEGAPGEGTAETEPAAGADDPAAGLAATTAATGIDIEQLVSDELNSRAERLRQDFEAEKRRIEEELAKTREPEPPPPEKEDGGSGSDGL